MQKLLKGEKVELLLQICNPQQQITGNKARAGQDGDSIQTFISWRNREAILNQLLFHQLLILKSSKLNLCLILKSKDVEINVVVFTEKESKLDQDY